MAVDRIGDGFALRAKGDIVSYDGTNPISISAGTNGQILYAQSSATAGVQWQTAPAAETQYMEVISSTYVSANTASVTIDNIPGTYKDLYVRYSIKHETADELGVKFNNTATTGTISFAYIGRNTAIDYNRSTTAGSVMIHNVYTTSMDSNQSFSPGHFTIHSYSNTSWHKPFSTHGGYFLTSNSASYMRTFQATINLTGAITRIDFFPTTASFVMAGSTIVLYGIKD